MESVPTRPNLRARLVVDDAEFTREPVDIVARTNYKALLDLGEGVMAVDEFVANHLDFVEVAENAPAFLELMAPAVGSANVDSS